MSAPPNYNASPSNPDTRPLPEGWITQFDNNYRTWFYVNTRAQPPATTWEHPLGPPPPSYAPPSHPPPTSGYNNNPGHSSGGYGESNTTPGSQTGSYAQPPIPEKNSYYQGGSSYSSAPPHGYSGAQGYQSSSSNPAAQAAGKFGSIFGGKHSGGSTSYAKPPKKHGGGMGMGGAALGVGAGVLGGLLVADAIDDIGDFDDGGDFGDF